MTKEEVKQFEKLNEKFVEDCKRVCRIFARKNVSYDFLEDFYCFGDEVVGKGEDGCGWDLEQYCESFNIECLTMTDEELHKMVDEEIEQMKEMERLHKLEEEEARKKKERATFLDLWEKYKDELPF